MFTKFYEGAGDQLWQYYSTHGPFEDNRGKIVNEVFVAFEKADTYQGTRQGMVYKLGAHGLGYDQDVGIQLDGGMVGANLWNPWGEEENVETVEPYVEQEDDWKYRGRSKGPAFRMEPTMERPTNVRQRDAHPYLDLCSYAERLNDAIRDVAKYRAWYDYGGISTNEAKNACRLFKHVIGNAWVIARHGCTYADEAIPYLSEIIKARWITCDDKWWLEAEEYRIRCEAETLEEAEVRRDLDGLLKWVKGGRLNGSSAICKAARDKLTWNWSESKSGNDVMDDASFVEDQMDDWRGCWGG